jgi:FAD/FMN-containing dehydrogenase/Fe-S oxidoreductase
MEQRKIISEHDFRTLDGLLKGDLFTGRMMRTLYATDASAYRELPLAVAYPKDAADIQELIRFAGRTGTSLIPRTAGTSLAGQCVGEGIVVDVSHYMNKILEVNQEEKWVRVEPGIIRDELNHFLKPYGLFFGPNTSTANRAMIGGMVGNNSCGSYSIVYGTTRDHTLELKCLLSDGSEAIFGPADQERLESLKASDSLEGKIYRQITEELSDKEIQEEIRVQFPRPEIHRRNTGYAVDALLAQAPFSPEGIDLNLCSLLCGSEGTLAIATEIKLNLDPLPPPELILICPHFTSIDESLRAVQVVMSFKPRAVEMMDKVVMDLSKENVEHERNRFFIHGDPAAILIIEFGGESRESALSKADALEKTLRKAGLGYEFPLVFPPDLNRVWEVRKAGLGLLANLPGDAKAVTVIEDTAVDIADLPAYIRDFSQMMARYGQEAVYYAHAGAGELHLRPILDLKLEKDRKDFREIARETALLVKKYRGSLSGEHGDGRVRAEFIPLVAGEKNYQLFRRIKKTWDPAGIFNPGKITDAPPMDESLRYEAGQPTAEFETVLDFSETGGILRMAEKCSGSGDCRKLPLSGGTMCPSYMASRNEKDTTRARANVLREFLTRSEKANKFDHEEIKEVMDLCLSCKGCKTECPSNVDMAALKAEFLHQYYKTHGVPLRSRAFASVSRLNRMAAIFPALSNFIQRQEPVKRLLGIAPERKLPALYRMTLRKWWHSIGRKTLPARPLKGKVLFFADEFTNYYDVEAGIAAIRLLTALGYEVILPDHVESGRAALSKGLLPMAKNFAAENVRRLADLAGPDLPLVGLEPSALLSFRDEYPRLLEGELKEKAKRLASHVKLFDAFIADEFAAGSITEAQFTRDSQKVLVHGHCHQKALSSVSPTVTALAIPENYTVDLIPSGCCGMAGSFGYEAEHYSMSMQIGELVLFPAVRKATANVLVAAPGTSCRHQIFDGTGRRALHPAQILWAAWKEE